MEKLFVVKIGGNVIDDESKLASFLQDFSGIKARKILVHGGGKTATRVGETMGIQQQLIDGRRITDAETLKVVTMVYAGYINKNIVAALQANNCNAIGLTGADANMMIAHKRTNPGMDYGFVGDIDIVNTALIENLLEKDITLVFAPLTHDQKGTLLNTNADTIAREIANSMGSLYDVSLIYCFEWSGVMMDTNDNNSVVQKITPSLYAELKACKIISAGMIPKIDNAFAALNNGVKDVVIGNAGDLNQLIFQQAGSSVVHE